MTLRKTLLSVRVTILCCCFLTVLFSQHHPALGKDIDHTSPALTKSHIQQPDPFRFGEKAPWYEPKNSAFQWSTILTTESNKVIFIALVGKKVNPDGTSFKGIYVEIVDGPKKIISVQQTLPQELRLKNTDLDVAIGSNFIKKINIDGKNKFLINFEVDDGKNKIIIAGELQQSISNCFDGGTPLLVDANEKKFVEFEFHCPHANLNGIIEINGKKAKLKGNGHIESVRWLKSKTDQPFEWFWGYAKMDSYFTLFLKPNYPEAKSILFLSSEDICLYQNNDADIEITEYPDLNELTISGDTDKLRAITKVRSEFFRQNDLLINVVPTRLSINHPNSNINTQKGVMILGRGKWDSF